jgi:hypothetical protein
MKVVNLSLFTNIGDEFRTRVKPYMQKALEKGVPSLFADLKELCADPEKQQAIESVATELQGHYEAQDESECISEL